jgi:hypothetical protein
MDITHIKKYLFKLFAIELIAFALTALLWFFRRSHGTPFYLCLFIIGVTFIGLGTLFYFSANNSVIDDYRRRAWGTSMTHAESGRRAWDDMTVSYFQASLFLWSGLIAAGLSLAYDFFFHNY